MSSRHHIYGPSTLDRLSTCVRFKYREMEDGAGEEGTALHEAYETGKLAGLNEEQKLAVQTIQNYTDSLKFEGGTTPEDWQEFRELKVELKGLTFGRADCFLACKKTRTVHVIDAKFTRVDSNHDMQLRTYGAAFIESNPGLYDTVVTHVVAPRLGRPDRKEYTADILLKDVREYITALYERVENPFTPPTPDEETCARCAWAGVCPALGNEVARAARGLGLPVPDSYVPGAGMSERDRAIAQVLRGVFNNWSELISKENTQFVVEGGTIPGFRVTHRSTGVKVPSEDTADALDALRALGIPERKLLECCTLVVGRVNKVIAKTMGMAEAAAKEQVRTTLSDLAVEGSCSFLQKERRISNEDLLADIIS